MTVQSGRLSPRTNAHDLAVFVDASPTPYHAVAEVSRRLQQAGFEALDEREEWHLEPGSRGFVRRGGGTLVAWQLGCERPSEAGYLMLGAHTDSPNLRLKPRPARDSVGYRQLGVELYGSVLWHTWLDRDLSIAGRVTLADGSTRLVRLGGAPCCIPSLAIHLDRTVNTDGLKLNPEEHLRPVIAADDPDAPGVLEWVVAELRATGLDGVGAEDINAFDLMLFDVQGTRFGGPTGELLHASRLDNLASCHAVLQALIAAKPRQITQLMVLNDHEEVGSETAHGAHSRFLLGLLERLDEKVTRAIARSLFVSVDMAHAVHPNYADRHDEEHRPLLGGGPVIKVNASQRYATEGPTRGVLVQACRAAGVEPQYYAGRNDVPCGSTIGSIAAARLGMRAADLGNPLLSMHSCRETADVRDVQPMVDVLTRLLCEGDPPDPAD